MKTDNPFSALDLLKIFVDETHKYGPTPDALNAAVSKMENALTGRYSDDCFRNTNRDLIPGIMRRYNQIWVAGVRKINKTSKVQLNEDYWSNKLILSMPELAKKAFPGKKVTNNLQAY